MKLLPGFGNAASSVPMSVQVDAILALRNIAKNEPKQVCRYPMFIIKVLVQKLYHHLIVLGSAIGIAAFYG